MGVEFSQDSRSDVKSDQIKLKELSPSCIQKLKIMFEKNPINTQPDKKQFMSLLSLGKRETDIIFEYFDMDGNGLIDSYEFICALAMLVHSSIDLKAEFMFKMYDFDNNNFLTREEVVYLIRNFSLASKRPVLSNDIEKRTDELIKNADIDMDKRISLKEFQSYLGKNRDIFIIFDNYSSLLSNNPMSTAVSNLNKKSKTRRMEQEDEEDQEGEDDVENNGVFEEDEAFQNADEMDPDLFNELNKDKIADERKEEDIQIKQGVEFKQSGMFEEEEELQGDQFGALKPWVTNLVHTIPSDYKPSSLDGAQPDANLELEFIHGYRCHDTRNNLRYTAEGKIVYHTAAVGIVYDKESNTQQFFLDHIDDITALAIHPNKQYVATGEVGPYPLISVWDTTTMKPLCKMNGPLTKGINHLAFSKDGKYLVATAADDNHGVAIFDWARGTVSDLSIYKGKQKAQMSTNPTVASGDGGRANILSACFNSSNDTVALTCVKEVNFINFANGKFAKKKATGLRGDNLTSIMCGVFLNNTLVCGSFNGSLLTFQGATFGKSIKAHTSCVNAIYLRENNTGFITGGNDGQILVFDSKFTITMKLSLNDNKIASLSPRVRSVCEDGNGGILVGTRGGDIVEFQGQTPEVLLRGHFDLELWGLCVHPKKNKFYTVGQDKMLALWDIETRKIEKITQIAEPVEFIHISPNGKDLAIGSKSGQLHIYDAISFEKKLTKNERKGQPIAAIKYSPDGAFLAAGGVDGMIFVYEVVQNYKRVKKLIGHTSRVTHIDWSADGEVLQSNSTSYELLYHSSSQGTQITKISSLKDTDWFTWSCVLGWPVQGIWPPCASGDDINAVDRDKSKKVIVTADDFGKVKLFKYPSPIDKASYKPFVGHSSHVTNVRFTAPNQNSPNTHVISTGGNDKAIFQWKFSYDEVAEKEAEQLEDIDDNEHIPEDEDVAYFKEDEMEATEFGAVKPWIGEVKASTPSNYEKTKNGHLAPTENIKKLRYVFGYRAFDTRMNIKYTGDQNKIVYHAAALGIVLDKQTNTQTFFTQHEEDIVALAIHPNKKIIATGQMAKSGKAKMIDLFVWDLTKLPNETNCEKSNKESVLGKEIRNLKGCHLRAIRVLQFSPDGTKLLSGGQDDDNSIAIHDWEKSQLIVKSPVDKARVLDAIWINNDEFVTVGPKHIKFFTQKGRTINVKRAVFGKMEVEPLISVCSAFENKSVITGTAKGNLIVWTGPTATVKKELCKGPIYCLYSKDNLLYVGGFDGCVYVFTNSKLLEKKDARIDLSQITRCDPGIRSIDINEKNNVLIGTKGGDIIELVNKQPKFLMSSHAEEELWGLCVNPTNPFLVASGGGDKTLRVWDIKNNKQIKFWICDQDFRAMDWSPCGKFIVIATMLGKVYYVQVDGDKCLPKGEAYQSIFKGEKQWIQELKISPNGKFAAYGSHCGVGATFSKIELLNLTNNSKCPFTQYAVVDPKITSALTHLDWDVDSDVIVCNSLAFELKFVSVQARKRVDSSAAKDRDWNTWTCLFGFPVQGIWPPEATGYIVNYTCMSNNKKLIATGDDFGLVKLFRSPCTVEKAAFKSYKGHSSHVPKIRFTAGDMFLVSVGGNDKCVFIWETDFGKNTGYSNEEDEEEDNGDEEQEDNRDEEQEDNGDEELEDNGDEEQEEEPEEEPEEELEEEPEEEPEEPEPEPEPPKKNKNTSTLKSQVATVKSNNNTSKTSFIPTLNNSKQNLNTLQTTSKSVNKTSNTPLIDTKTSSKINIQSTKSAKVSNLNSSTKFSLTKTETFKSKIPEKKGKVNVQFNDDDDFQGDMAGAPGDSNLEQWRSVIEAPENTSGLPTDLNLAPKAKLKLDHVFGYRTKDTKNNLSYITDDLVAYHAGSLGIIHNLKTNTQNFFTGHKQDILSFAINSDKNLIATGEATSQNDFKVCLCIWNKEGKEIYKFEGMFEKGIVAMSFSPNSSKLVVCTLDDAHTMFLFDLKEKKILHSLSIDSQYKILDTCFKNDSEFVTVGIKHYKFWMLSDDYQNLICKEGVFGLDSTNKIDVKLGVVKVSNGNLVTGSATGEITLWKDDRIMIMKKCHTKNVDTIYTRENFIISGGRDYSIVILDNNLSELRRILLEPTKLDSVMSVPRSLELGINGLDKILLGTLSSEIFELTFDSGNFLYGDYKATNYLYAHYSTASSESNEISGLTYISSKDLFVTVSEDCTLRFWDATAKKQIEYLKLEVDNNGKKIKSESGENINKALCVSSDNKGNNLSVGFIDGSIRVYSIEDLSITKLVKIKDCAISDLKFSPDGLLIACSFKDGSIDILKTEDYSKISSLEAHSAPVNHIDWSTSSNYLSSSSVNGELNFYNVKKATKILRTSDVRNEEWHTWNRVYGWHIQGIWDKSNGMVTVVDVSKKEVKSSRLLAVGDESGVLMLYKYPCISSSQNCLVGLGHGQKINNLRFNDLGNVLLTTSSDGCVFKWILS